MEYMREGILTTIIGMGVVFIVLIALSLFIQGLNYIVDKAMASSSKEKAVTDKKMSESMDGNLATIAAIITASICILSGKSSKDFRIKEIRVIGK